MGKKRISRRGFLKKTAAAGAMLPLAGLSASAWAGPAAGERAAESPDLFQRPGAALDQPAGLEPP